MSFCSDCKSEIMDSAQFDNCCLYSHLYGFLCFFPRISGSEMLLNSENLDIIEYLVSLFDRIGVPLGKEVITKGKKINTFRCTDEKVCEKILSDFFLSDGRIQMKISTDHFVCQNCARSFIAGAFLAAGVVSEPHKGYHLEFSTHRARIAQDLAELLTAQGFDVKRSARGYDSLVYVKDSSQIEDILTFIGAPLCSMRLMEEKIVRDVRNQVTRRVNCENANMTKAVSAAYNDIELFEEFFRRGGRKLLSSDLLKAADLRISNPDLSLGELADKTDDGITKSGMSHRLRKIRETARGYLNEHDDQ
ncbi:MAG: DNA-binding protein WhiA [Oscillospiraceae bacterium]|nr:DNA-binding protein WhiA [Oscillospiraceae bacterium]